MSAAEPILVARGPADLFLLPQMANRHGLIAGATGTGKTVTLQVLAEGFSRLGVPVFLADVKGDLSGISQPGAPTPKVAERLRQLGLTDFAFAGRPVTFWDVHGEQGHPIRATISEQAVDRDSAYERLKGAQPAPPTGAPSAPPAGGGGWFSSLFGGGAASPSPAPPVRGRPGRQPDTMATTMMKSAVRSIGSSVGREIVRGVLGSIFGGTRRR